MTRAIRQFLLPEANKLSKTMRLVKINPMFDKNPNKSKQKPKQEPEDEFIHPGFISRKLSVPRYIK